MSSAIFFFFLSGEFSVNIQGSAQMEPPWDFRQGGGRQKWQKIHHKSKGWSSFTVLCCRRKNSTTFLSAFRKHRHLMLGHEFQKGGDFNTKSSFSAFTLIFLCTGQKVPLCQSVFRQLPQDWTDYLFYTHPDSTGRRTSLWVHISLGVGRALSVFRASQNSLIICFNSEQTDFYFFYWYTD